MPTVPPPSERSRYYPLYAYLAALPDEQAAVRLSFRQIEELLMADLPSSAWVRGWWTSRAAYGAPLAWLAAGWHVAALHLGHLTVTFQRQPPAAVVVVRR